MRNPCLRGALIDPHPERCYHGGMHIKRRLLSIAAVGGSVLVFYLLGFDLKDEKNLAIAIFTGVGVYFAGLLLVWAVNRIHQ